MPDDCTVEPIPWPTPEEYPGCEICQAHDWCFYNAYLGCMTPPPGQTCADVCPSGNCLADYWNSCDGELFGEFPEDTCGYYEIDGKCCTIGKFFAGCAE